MEADHDLVTAIYGAQGIKVPPMKKADRSPQSVAESMRQWARTQNTKIRAKRSVEEAKARALAKATQPPETA